MELAHAGLAHLQNCADFPQVQLFLVVEAQQEAIPLGQAGDGIHQLVAKTAFEQRLQGVVAAASVFPGFSRVFVKKLLVCLDLREVFDIQQLATLNFLQQGLIGL